MLEYKLDYCNNESRFDLLKDGIRIYSTQVQNKKSPYDIHGINFTANTRRVLNIQKIPKLTDALETAHFAIISFANLAGLRDIKNLNDTTPYKGKIPPKKINLIDRTKLDFTIPELFTCHYPDC